MQTHSPIRLDQHNHDRHSLDHHSHDRHDQNARARHQHGHAASLDRTALLATLHCLSGCAVGEVLGMVIGTHLGWGNMETIALAVVLAFAFGYAFTMVPLLKAGLPFKQAASLALAADSASIAIMELTDNLVMLAIPGAMDAPLSSALFWASLGFSLLLASLAAFPVNRALIRRGRGHAVVHAHHGQTHQ